MNVYDESIAGRACRVFSEGEGGAVLFWARDLDETDEVITLVSEKLAGTPFTVVAFSADWDRELTPWRVEGVFKNRVFAGEGKTVLNWLRDYAVPRFPAKRHFIGGYSLGGLFALWAYCECGLFSGAASASGSLWYPGFKEYAEKVTLRENTCVYLSLGDREERTRNPIMAQVGDATRAFDAKCDGAGIDHIFEWNEGNHFSDPAGRTAKAFAWVLK